MQYKIRYKPSFSTLFVTLEPGQSITAEAGAMTSMNAKLSMKTEFSGGFFSGLIKKFFGGESLFVNHFINNTQEPLEVVLSQSIIGDIVALELDGGRKLNFQPGAYLASTDKVKLGVGWAGFGSWFAGEGLFKLKVTGPGVVFFGAYGGITEKEITKEMIVDNGHLVAYEPGIKMSVSIVGGIRGIISSITSREGFVNRVKGRGKIYLQSRSLDGIVKFLSPKFPMS